MNRKENIRNHVESCITEEEDEEANDYNETFLICSKLDFGYLSSMMKQKMV